MKALRVEVVKESLIVTLLGKSDITVDYAVALGPVASVMSPTAASLVYQRISGLDITEVVKTGRFTNPETMEIVMVTIVDVMERLAMDLTANSGARGLAQEALPNVRRILRLVQEWRQSYLIASSETPSMLFSCRGDKGVDVRLVYRSDEGCTVAREWLRSLTMVRNERCERDYRETFVKIGKGINCYAGEVMVRLYVGAEQITEKLDEITRLIEHRPTDPTAEEAWMREIVEQDVEKLKGMIELVNGKEDFELGEMSRIYRLIEAADRRRDEVVLCLMGEPGIGKTQAIERFARDHDRNVVHIIASQVMPNEVSGMTMPNQETHSMDVFDHARLGHLRDGDIVFFDELLKGQQQVLNACLTLIQERRLMSGKRLPDVLVIAAANPLPSARQLPVEIRQRFLFVDVSWDRDEWSRYMLDQHGFEITESLLDVIEKDLGDIVKGTDSWNSLTPRSATKMLLWADSAYGTSNYDCVVDEIRRAYSSVVSSEMRKVIASKHSSKSTFLSGMRHIITEHGLDGTEAAERVMDMVEENRLDSESMAKLMKALQSLPQWEEIRRELESMSVNDVDVTGSDESIKY